MATCKQENQFLPSQGEGVGPGKDGVPPSPPPPPQEWGKEPEPAGAGWHFLLDTGTLGLLGYYRDTPSAKVWSGPLVG